MLLLKNKVKKKKKGVVIFLFNLISSTRCNTRRRKEAPHLEKTNTKRKTFIIHSLKMVGAGLQEQ